MAKPKTIRELYEIFHLPDNIKAHMKKVAAVAVFIAKAINKRAKERIVRQRTLYRAAMLHDLFKMCDFDNDDHIFCDGQKGKQRMAVCKNIKKRFDKTDHVKMAFLYFRSVGQAEVAQIIKKHDYFAIINHDPRERPSSLEEMILYYADKRVRHDRIVSLQTRLKDGRKRYGMGKKFNLREKKREEKIEKAILTLEKSLCKMAGIKPAMISEKKIV